MILDSSYFLQLYKYLLYMQMKKLSHILIHHHYVSWRVWYTWPISVFKFLHTHSTWVYLLLNWLILVLSDHKMLLKQASFFIHMFIRKLNVIFFFFFSSLIILRQCFHILSHQNVYNNCLLVKLRASNNSLQLILDFCLAIQISFSKSFLEYQFLVNIQ